MTDSPLLVKSKAFALRCRRLCDDVQKTKREYRYSDQLLRASSSVGANLREAVYGRSRAWFIAKQQIALQEASESEYWLELLIESGYCEDVETLGLCRELFGMLTAAVNLAKKKQV